MSGGIASCVRYGGASFLTSTARRRQACSNLYILLSPANRCINTTAIRQGRSKQQKAERKLVFTPLPVFPKTSNPELDDLLNTLREEQFVIDHLPAKFRKIVVKPTKHHLLTDVQQGSSSEEVMEQTLRIDGQTIPLTPVTDRKTHSGKDITKALKLMKSPSDYDVLIPMVEGMAYSKVEVSEREWAVMVRECGLAGRPGIGMAAATDGWNLRRNEFPVSKAVGRELMRSYITRSLLSASNESARQAYKIKVLFNAEYQRHQGTKAEDSNRWLLNDPVITGTRLLISANRQVRQLKPKEVDLTLWVVSIKSFIKSWTVAKSEIEEYRQALTSEAYTPPTFIHHNKSDTKQHIARQVLIDYEPVLLGLQKTLEVVKPVADKGKSFAKIIEDLPAMVKELEGEVAFWKTYAAEPASEHNYSIVGMGVYVKAAEALDKLIAVPEAPQELLRDTQPMPGFYHTAYVKTLIGTEEPLAAEEAAAL